MTETTTERVARLAAELAAANADLEQERQAAEQIRQEALVDFVLDVLSKAVDYQVGHVFEVSDLFDLPVDALLEEYEDGKMNLVVSRMCSRKGHVSAGYPVDKGNSSYRDSETVAVTVLVPLSEVQPMLDQYLPH